MTTLHSSRLLPYFTILIFSTTVFLGFSTLARGQEITLPPVLSQPAEQPQKEEFRTFTATRQEQDGKIYRLRGAVKIETETTLLEADEIDYNSETGDASARGNVRYKNLISKENIQAERAEYNVNTEEGQFWNVTGTSPSQIQARPGLLTTNNPLYFEGERAEKQGEKYVLYNGAVTNCSVPKPWWMLRGPKFDIVPNERAISYSSVFRLRGVPIFYSPYYYKTLGKEQRKSGFLAPLIGNSNRLGQTLGLTYYWAINRSYDATYRGQYYTLRGLAHNLDFRGKPNDRTSFNGVLFAVQDKGLQTGGGNVRKFPGYSINLQGRSDLGKGFFARGQLNYLSSFRFRQEFSQNFNEAINSEVNSVGFITKQWSSYSLNLVVTRFQNFYITPTDVRDDSGQIIRPSNREVNTTIRRLPEVEFRSRDRQINRRILPLWFSWNTQAGLLSRDQPEFQTSNFSERLSVTPRLTTRLNFLNIQIIPSFGLNATHYGSRLENGRLEQTSLFRRAGDINVDVILPSLTRVFNAKGLWGTKLKHVIEPRLTYRYVNGIEGTTFRRIVRFDELDLLTNTNQVEISLTNRFYGKQANGQTREVLSWELSQRRYFDPTFGGVIQPNARNVIYETVSFTPLAFIDGRRTYSPIRSALRVSPDPRIGFEWVADYDPLRQRVSNSSVNADARLGLITAAVGHVQIRSNPLLSPNTNQFTGLVALGRDTRRGWNVASRFNYDYRVGVLNEATTQVTYNTDCCGFSVQYLRFGFRNENQFRIAFVVANLGSFGTLRRQDRLY